MDVTKDMAKATKGGIQTAVSMFAVEKNKGTPWINRHYKSIIRVYVIYGPDFLSSEMNTMEN
jgi:hypothetical protein